MRKPAKRRVHYLGRGFSLGQATGMPEGKPACGARAKTGTIQPSQVTCAKCKRLVYA